MCLRCRKAIRRLFNPSNSKPFPSKSRPPSGPNKVQLSHDYATPPAGRLAGVICVRILDRRKSLHPAPRTTIDTARFLQVDSSVLQRSQIHAVQARCLSTALNPDPPSAPEYYLRMQFRETITLSEPAIRVGDPANNLVNIQRGDAARRQMPTRIDMWHCRTYPPHCIEILGC